MSNGSGSDSGSSSQTSSFDYESEAYSPSQSFDYESDAAGLTTTTDYGDSGAVDTGDLGSVAANVGSTESATQFEPTTSIGDVARGALDIYSRISPLANIARGVGAVRDAFTPDMPYDYEYDAFASQNIPGYVSGSREAFASDADYQRSLRDAERATESLSGMNVDYLTGTGDNDNVNALAPVAPYVVSGQQPIQSMVNEYFNNIGNQSGLSSQLESDYNTAKANVANTLSVTPLAQQFGYSTQPYGGLTATNLSTNPFNIEYLQTRGLI
jgi:hypothetical protein